MAETEKQKYERVQKEEVRKQRVAKEKAEYENIKKEEARKQRVANEKTVKKKAAKKKAEPAAKPKKIKCNNTVLFKLTGKKMTAVFLCPQHLKRWIGENNPWSFKLTELKKSKEACQYI